MPTLLPKMIKYELIINTVMVYWFYKEMIVKEAANIPKKLIEIYAPPNSQIYL